MATLRELRTRVASISNIQRVTNAMQMVAAAKMRRAQDAIIAARPYAEQLDQVLRQLQGSVSEEGHPLLSERPVSKAAVVVVTADRGLCGAFNTNICRHARTSISEMGEVDVEIVTVGRKGRTYFNNRGFAVGQHHADVFADLNFSRAVQIASDLSQRFLAGEIDRVSLVFSQFLSVARQVPIMQQLLPIPPQEAVEGEAGVAGEYLFEPEPGALLDQLVPRQVNFQVWRALLESNAGEQAARMTAMDNATKNAGELIEDLTREMNKERQSSITLELMDIIGGAEAVA